MEKIKQKKKEIIKITIASLVVMPIIVYFLTVIPLFPAGANNDWAGFWGGYLGAVIGGILTLIGVVITIKYEEQVRIDNETRLIRPVLSGRIEILERKDIENLKNGRGAILNIAGEKAGNGERYDKSFCEEYLKDKGDKKNKIIRYRLVNLSNYSANNVSVKVNDREEFTQFSLLPMDEAVVFFIMSLGCSENEKCTKLHLEFIFEDEIGKRRYKQTDKLEFYKDKNGEIYNNCGIMAMTSPEEIKRED